MPGSDNNDDATHAPTDPIPLIRSAPTSDDDRALAGQRWRTPPHGVPVHVPEPDDFTPVGDVMPLAGGDEALRIMLARIWQHTANMEMRLKSQLAESEAGRLHYEIDRLHTAITDIRGEHGTNGKLGEIRRRVDALTSWARSIVMLALGGIGAAAIKLVMVTRAFDAVAADASHARDEIRILQAQVMTLQTALIARRFRPAVEPGNGSGQ